MSFNRVIQQWCPFFKLVIPPRLLFSPQLFWPHLQSRASANYLSICEFFLLKRFCNQSWRQLWTIFLFVCFIELYIILLLANTCLFFWFQKILVRGGEKEGGRWSKRGQRCADIKEFKNIPAIFLLTLHDWFIICHSKMNGSVHFLYVFSHAGVINVSLICISSW